MIAALYCFREVRKNAVDASLFRLGVEKLKNEDILRMPWGELEDKIIAWNKQLKVAVRNLPIHAARACSQSPWLQWKLPGRFWLCLSVRSS